MSIWFSKGTIPKTVMSREPDGDDKGSEKKKQSQDVLRRLNLTDFGITLDEILSQANVSEDEYIQS